ncbi:Serotonin N-acetyltransferase [Wickerhamomyces ciferrii]|uniref:Serotonin N-acetyltransferase n=1 Tax=Wickerhamomyces ciferrii (strain ATCC 14091 / BCRC 22168 / CBS 111 / JCM 3599 / NBRC 0793 / NRRL Y-1031 F-60-10) TaxID=1206466 RepID=K0KIT5_WICCF|nr:Serotonin N-acetyltransferase [Wickerhamomyces ciferrii]CCH45130.1 Serotonin N-acetyltransferase [Wickerhamomyces ciferrii]
MSSDLPLHLAIRPLTLEDVDKVLELEAIGFPPSERCSLKSANYRLSACPELSSGLFIREFKSKYNTKDQKDDDHDDDDKNKSSIDDDYLPEPRTTIVHERLIGQIIGTKIYGDFVTNGSMEVPELNENGTPVNEEETRKGHIESSNTIGIHSVVVHPEYQKKNLATLLLHDYIQKLSNQQVGEKIAIIAKENLLPFYNRIGFITKGLSDCKHGGETWYDLHCALAPEDELDA